MKCYVFRWNPETSAIRKENFKEFYNQINEPDGENCFTWEIKDWQDAHKDDMFIFLQTHTDNDGIVMIGKLASEPYYKESKRTGYKGYVVDLEILTMFDRTPECKTLVAFQLENEFPEIKWHDGNCGELLEMLLADRLSIRIMDELCERGIWEHTTFAKFMGLEMICK